MTQQAPENFLESERNTGSRKYTKEEVIAALIKTGTISGASTLLGADRGTIKRYIDDDPEIENAVLEAKEILIDLAETGLIKNVKKGDQSAINYVLSTLGKERGYVRRVENTGKGGGPIQSEIKVKSNNKNVLDKIDKLKRQIEKEDKPDKKQSKVKRK